jgi:hypothetical protein
MSQIEWFKKKDRKNSPKESPYIYTWYKSGTKNIERCLNFFPFHILLIAKFG